MRCDNAYAIQITLAGLALLCAACAHRQRAAESSTTPPPAAWADSESNSPPQDLVIEGTAGDGIPIAFD